jgi:hypothetical protein
VQYIERKIINIINKEKYCGNYLSVGFAENGGTLGIETDCDMSK